MRIVKLFVIAFVSLMYSCGNTNTPENTVNQFHEAIKSKDFPKAKELATEKSKTYVSMLGSTISIELGTGKITNIDCVTESTISNCDCFFENKEKPFPVSLVKENEAWKVDLQASAVNVMDDLLDGFKGIDLNGLMEKVGAGVDLSSEGINELINNIDINKAVETLKGLDSNFNETGGNIENLINQVTEGLEKSN